VPSLRHYTAKAAALLTWSTSIVVTAPQKAGECGSAGTPVAFGSGEESARRHKVPAVA